MSSRRTRCGMSGLPLRWGGALGKAKRLGQVIQNGGKCPADGAEQIVSDLDRIKAPLRVWYPLLARHADVVHACHRVNAAQGLRLAEKQQTSDRGNQCAGMTPGAAQGFEQFLIAPAQFLGIGIGFGTHLSVVSDRLRRQVRQRGIGQDRVIKTLDLAPLIEDEQVIFRTLLIRAADPPESAFWQSARLDEYRLVPRLCLGDGNDEHGLAADLLAGDLNANWHIELFAALRSQRGAERVGLRHAFNDVRREQVRFIPHDAQQKHAALQSRLVGERADGFQYGRADFTSALSLQALVLIERVQHQKVIGGTHCVTSPSSAAISASTCFNSASMSSSLRGDWYL